MKIKYLGHASFLITSDNGTRIVTDPYVPAFVAGDGPSYGEINETADIVTVSHDHSDHNNVAAVRGNPKVVRDTTEIQGIKFMGIPTYHDEAQGKQRGSNTILCFEVDGMRVCHLGDLGHVLSDKEISELGEVDIVLTPVGGFFTIDAKQASEICDKVKPRVIIPMHYKTPKCGYPIAGVDEFLQGKDQVVRTGTSETEFTKEKPSTISQIVVLEPAM